MTPEYKKKFRLITLHDRIEALWSSSLSIKEQNEFRRIYTLMEQGVYNQTQCYNQIYRMINDPVSYWS